MFQGPVETGPFSLVDFFIGGMVEQTMDVFSALGMQRVDAATLDDTLLQADDAVRILFLWGNDCPNCDVAKSQLLQAPDRFRWRDVAWLHQNVYDEPALATRFGLHGIPAFMVFRGQRRIGRISPWPGSDAFVAAIERVRAG